jgi:RNA polymerase sigma factor for flagellar operon FliA
MKAAKNAYEAVSHLEPTERERLLLDQLPQVRYIARRIHDRLPPHVQMDDLVQAGILGLIEALHKYDPSKNVELKSYAKHRIQGAILDSLRELDWSPRPLRKKARQLEQAHQRLRARLSRPATEPEVALELGIDLKELHRLQADLRGLDLGSLQEEFGAGGQDYESRTPHTGNATEEPFSKCLQGEVKELLSQAIGELPPRERQVLALYYYEELTMKEVGAVLGVGEARVSQIHSAALVRLRARMRDLLESPRAGSEGIIPTQTVTTETAWRRY